MTIEEMIRRKQELGYSYEYISEQCGLPLSTVQKVLGGFTKSPRRSTVEALEKLFSEKTDEKYVSPISAASFCEPAGALNYIYSEKSMSKPELKLIKCEGPYTIESYHDYTASGEKRAELINGFIYDMAAPTVVHQIIVSRLYLSLQKYIDENGGKCVAFAASPDVQVLKDDRNVFQPDVQVICQREKLEKGRIFGAPDMVIEVLSPSTRTVDLYKKAEVYALSDTREVWFVDPENRSIEIRGKGGKALGIYTFNDVIPVDIYGGNLKIDFAEISNYLNDLFGDEW